MPKVSKVELIYEGSSRIKHDIHYSQKDLFSIKGLSSEFLTLTNILTSGYETEANLIEVVQKACRKFRELKTTEKIVILYKCSASAILRMNEIGKGEYLGILKGVSKNICGFGFREPYASFGIDYKVAKMVNDGINEKYYFFDTKTEQVSGYELGIDSSWQKMEYTQEREAFFHTIVESMKNLVIKISTFFDASPEEAANLIENNIKLLK